MKRSLFLTMVSGSVLILFTGFVNIWSVFVPYVMEGTGWTQESITLAFYISTCCFVLGNIVGGRLTNRWAGQKIIAFGGGIFAAAIFLAGTALNVSPLLLYLTYGLLMGGGAGMAYSVILATAQKWFPGRTGFASGVIIASNGLCGFFIAPLCRLLLGRSSVTITLWVVSAMVAAAVIFSSIFVKEPSENETFAEPDSVMEETSRKSAQEKHQYTSQEMLRSSSFYMLTLAMFFGLMPYYLVSPVSQIFQTERGVSESVAVMSVMLGALLNASARLILPTLADRLGRFRCLILLLCASMISSILLTVGQGYALTIAVILAYGCFGGVMGSFPSLSSMLFGMKHAGENYGYVMIGMILSAILSPVISSVLSGLGMSGSRLYIFSVIFAALAIGLLGKLQKKEDGENGKTFQTSVRMQKNGGNIENG